LKSRAAQIVSLRRLIKDRFVESKAFSSGVMWLRSILD
jgi:hypothetical protein